MCCDCKGKMDDKVNFSDDVKFSYYGDVSNICGHDGVVTICSRVNEEDGIVEYGVAYCSPDDKYDKYYGKVLAYNRMYHYKNAILLGKKRHHEINAKIFSSIVAYDEFPLWVKEDIYSYAINHLMRAI